MHLLSSNLWKINTFHNYLKVSWGLDKNISSYLQAVTHKSYDKANNNERLEFIGDVVLGLAVSDYLYTNYKEKDEGKLSLLRSRLVSRKCLNSLGKAMGLRGHILCDESLKENKDITGNAIEAMFGAIYINHGFEFSKGFIMGLMKKYLDLEDWLIEEKNPKSKLLEWGQKNNKQISFVFINESGGSNAQIVTMGLKIDGKKVAEREANSKKEAEFLLAENYLSKI